jgi:EAL domain-containing protein (putative c-di-GMP-specific phosphodiesterase class I)
VAIERASLLRCCEIQRRLSERGKARAMIFRISSAAIRDRVFLERLVEEIRPDPLLTDLLIFEVDQGVIEQGDGVEREGMEILAGAGFRFSLGSAETLGLDVEELSVRRIGYVRVTPSVLATEQNPVAVTELRNGGIETIVTAIVSEEDVRAARAFGLVLGQGRLFSEAKPLRADVAGAAPAPGAAKPGRSTRAA